jgi:hypothetical protein
MNGRRDETSCRDVACNVSLSKRNRDSSMPEGNRIKQGFEELAARIVKPFNQRFEEEKQRPEKPSPNRVEASAV